MGDTEQFTIHFVKIILQSNLNYNYNFLLLPLFISTNALEQSVSNSVNTKQKKIIKMYRNTCI